ncbi:hypothetical protein BAE44_0023637, partial [Dichanthelium oligosanthes]
LPPPTVARGNVSLWTWTSGPRSRSRGPPRRTAPCCSVCRRSSWARMTASACSWPSPPTPRAPA